MGTMIGPLNRPSPGPAKYGSQSLCNHDLFDLVDLVGLVPPLYLYAVAIRAKSKRPGFPQQIQSAFQ